MINEKHILYDGSIRQKVTSLHTKIVMFIETPIRDVP